MKQSEAFLQSEGAAWLERNKDKLPPDRDPVINIIEMASISPNNVLEIGCGNGWRLDQLQDKYKCNVYGIEPGLDVAFTNGIFKGTADDLGVFSSSKFDLVIYGFCLYLVDREDFFKVVCEGDRVLKDGGHLIIHDFMPVAPYKVKYKHRDGIFSYKMDYSELWLANPSYYLVDSESDQDAVGVSVLKKDIVNGWPIKD